MMKKNVSRRGYSTPAPVLGSLDLRGCDEGEALLEEVEMGFGVFGGVFCAEWGGEGGEVPLLGVEFAVSG